MPQLKYFLLRLCYLLAAVSWLSVSCSRIVLESKLCKEVPLEERENMANVVLSGTVKEIMPDPANNKMYKGKVEIIRIFKGEKLLHSMHDPISENTNHKMVMVEGLGDPDICDSAPRTSDTRIFLLQKDKNDHLKLNSSIVRLNLFNLDYVDAAVKDIPFKIPEKPKEPPCKHFYCAFWAVCAVNETTDTPYCQCTEQCSNVFAPVCGNDNITYSSECFLKMASCRKQRRIKVKQPFPCGKRNPCTGVACNFGARCVPSITGMTARCQCPHKCYTYGDNIEGSSVCGNDGVEYPNLCELNKAACSQMVDIKVKYIGRCDPCDGHKCPPPQVCQLDDNDRRKPICRCNLVCTLDFNPVCGTDGKTYSNECVMKREACKFRRQIDVLYRGHCDNGFNPCDEIRCSPEEECSINRQGQASCVCPPPCETILRPVCGNDSNTYDNDCELRRRSCLNKMNVEIAYRGPCGPQTPCTNYKCPHGGICVISGGKPVCECPHCTQEFSPVCGSDSITYGNECKLRQENCERKMDVHIRSLGPCNGCEEKNCEFYSVCESDGIDARCVCPSTCVQVESKVCGTDGVTYLNECELKVASCKKKEFITVSSRGECDLCANVNCKFGSKCEDGRCVCPSYCRVNYEPLCGSDGKTYNNDCEMKKASCLSSSDIDVTHSGECEDEASGSGEIGSGDGGMMVCDEMNCRFGGTCIMNSDGLHECACSIICDAVRAPVCGSDGKTYGNECQLNLESCKQQREIYRRPIENCEDMTEDPCDGSRPLIDPNTNQEYDCSADQKSCPAGSYCHRGLDFSKCCQEETHPIRGCGDTKYGCCADRKTPAPGLHRRGCPEFCNCNTLGSNSRTCDPRTRRCSCKPGVGGQQCDRCESGFWGLPKIADGNVGCIPCACNIYGAERDDCDQMTGKCECKKSISGMKCNICANGKRLTPQGCDIDISVSVPKSCNNLTCVDGAVCKEFDNYAECVCDITCDDKYSREVCGTDGYTHGSECQLRLFACRLQTDIQYLYAGPCTENGGYPNNYPGTTILPLTRLSTTRSRKTTRHLMDKVSSEVTKIILTRATEKPPTGEKEPIFGKIDDLCLENKHCPINNSQCQLGLCKCYDDYVPSVDHSQCIAIVRPSVSLPSSVGSTDLDACQIDPCSKGGTCILDDTFGYRCLCPLGKNGPVCKDDVRINTPSFSGTSYLVLPKLMEVTKDMSIEIQFQALNQDGILFFSSQHQDGTGDFVSLSVRDKYVEFRYDLGGGPAILVSKRQIDLGKHHRVSAKRLGRKGELLLDEEEPVLGESPPLLASLGLDKEVYLGYIPESHKKGFRRFGVDVGLVGCIHSFSAGSRSFPKLFDLRYPGKDIFDGASISECGNNPCGTMPCKNGGTCFMLDEMEFECLCRDGYLGETCTEFTDPCEAQPCKNGGTCEAKSEGLYMCHCKVGIDGKNCENDVLKKIFVPQFTGDSYLQLPLDDSIGRELVIEVWFMANEKNGVILYASQFEGGLGDFISLNLVDGHLEFRYDLGGGVAVIKSANEIVLNEWNTVMIERLRRDGQLTVNDRKPNKGKSMGSQIELNLARPLYIGGFKDTFDLPAESKIKSGFYGSIQRIYINGRLIDDLINTAEDVRNVSDYDGPPCNFNPCMNGGVCVPRLSDVECRCPVKYVGKQCEKMTDHLDTDQPVKFSGSTYLQYPSDVDKMLPNQQTNKIKMRIRTRDKNGLILFQGEDSTVSGDYISLAIADGHVEFSYNLGKQTESNLHILKSSRIVNDGKWHDVVVSREQGRGFLQVDTEKPITKNSLEGALQLNTDGYLWIGGKPDLPSGLPSQYYSSFIGCISDVHVNDKELHLVVHRNGHGTTIVEFCN